MARCQKADKRLEIIQQGINHIKAQVVHKHEERFGHQMFRIVIRQIERILQAKHCVWQVAMASSKSQYMMNMNHKHET